MKGTISIFLAALLLGCSPQKEVSRPDRTVIFVSIPPQAGLLKAMVRDGVEIRTLVGPGQSPHAYEPTARQLAALGGADLLFTIGVPFEAALLKKIQPLYPDLPIIGTDSAVVKRVLPHEHHGETCTHGHGEADPHIWLSPANARTLAAAMFQALEPRGAADPEKYRALVQSLEKLDAETAARLAPFKGCRFYVFHPSFGYFAERYGLVQVPIELDGKSPSPRQLGRLIEQARTDGVQVIFVQKQFPAESAKAIADAIGGRVVPLDPLAEDLVANLKQIADAVATALKP